MRAGRLAQRTYKTGRGRGWVFPAVMALLMLTGWALWRQPGPEPALTVEPAPTLSPAESALAERTLTLPGQSWYALQLGLFDTPQAARQQAEAFRARGAGGYVMEKEGWRVLAAAYTARADAQAVQHQLKTRSGVDTVIVEIQQPQVTLGLKGQQAQLTALSDALDGVGKLTEHVSALSAALDEGKLTLQEAQAALQSERDTLNALNGQLARLFPSAVHPAVTGLEALLADSAQSLDGALSAPTALGLGAQLKFCQLQCLCRMAAYAAELSEC